MNMARNKYPGVCYCCGVYVPPGYGHFEKIRGAAGWRIKCVKCASGRVLSDKDPGVKWAQKAAKEAQP
jgi:ribosomal protein L24E